NGKETLLAFHMDNGSGEMATLSLGTVAEVMTMFAMVFKGNHMENMLLGGIAVANRNSGGRLLAKLQDFCAKVDEIELPAKE
ncbi:MAG: hypothetical protein IJK29_02265, partial [Bacteroidales bacterium]|nr:hypothetical protein [Bacteroidales bacterium]